MTWGSRTLYLCTLIENMLQYQNVFQILNISSSITDCALGKIPIPLIGWSAPSQWYGFPPALLPIASSGSGPTYFGVWNHWFSNRSPSYVKMYVGSNRMALEIARTPEQLFCYIAMSSLAIDEGITPALEDFARRAGINNLSELNSVSLQTGDDPLGFAMLQQYRSQLPLCSAKVASEYTGDFPTDNALNASYRWQNACSFEISSEALSGWPSSLVRPRWLTTEDKLHVFSNLINIGDLHGAWLTLNSTGWEIDVAKAALHELAQVAQDLRFAALADAWIAVADSGVGAY